MFGKPTYDICSECKEEKLIVNKRYKLCDYHNKKRLSERKTKKEEGVKKQMNQISKKQAYINKMYNKTIKEFDEVTPKYCTGCGNKNLLSHSHLISRSDCKRIGKPELIYDINNITYHCMGNCHEKWENPKERYKLLDYYKNIEYIKSVSEEMYKKYKNNNTL